MLSIFVSLYSLGPCRKYPKKKMAKVIECCRRLNKADSIINNYVYSLLLASVSELMAKETILILYL